MAASGAPTSRATAIAASAFSTLCSPGRFSSTSSGAKPPLVGHGAKAHAPVVPAHVLGAQVRIGSPCRR